MNLEHDLEEIVGSENISCDPQIIRKYSKDYSFVTGSRPSCVVFPENSEEIRGIVAYANEYKIPMTPRSSGIGFYGAALPDQGGIVIDLSRMNKILHIDPGNKMVRIEPGVTWGQIGSALEKEGLMLCNPLLPHSSKSVLTSCMEREPLLIPKGEYNEPFLTAEMILPNGKMYWLGTAMGKGFKSGNFPDFLYPGTRLFMGAQGTLGIVSWANIKAEWLPGMEKLFFMAFEKIEDLSEAIYRIQWLMIGRECFVLNSFNLALILAENISFDFHSLREKFPPWMLILSLAGLHRHPEKKIRYEENALLEVGKAMNIDIQPTLSNIPGLGKKIKGLLRRPWENGEYWKFRYKGSCQDIFFHTTLARVKDFYEAVKDLAVKYGYNSKDIGFYLQPIEYGRACFCQFSFHFNPENDAEVDRVRGIFIKASECAMDMGGLFTTPYGSWADMVYQRTHPYLDVMKTAKQAVDPNNIMNPGKLCL
jgi:FAD/FMN-containing dehydrogenase